MREESTEGAQGMNPALEGVEGVGMEREGKCGVGSQQGLKNVNGGGMCTLVAVSCAPGTSRSRSPLLPRSRSPVIYSCLVLSHPLIFLHPLCSPSCCGQSFGYRVPDMVR